MTYIETLKDLIISNPNFFIWFGIVLIAFYILRYLIINRIARIAKKTKNDIDDAVIEVIKTINIVFAIAISVITGLYSVGYSFFESRIFLVIAVIVITYQVSKAFAVLLDYGVEKLADKKTLAAFQGLKTVIKILVWIGGIIFLIGALGYNITSMVAGLGIGGIAIALAAQNILSDIFSSFSIYFDRPFQVGDHIVSGTKEGEVERIGLKTTRIRSPRGEEIVISNQSLTSTVVQNFGELKRRRAVDTLGLTYNTPDSKLKNLQKDIKEIVNSVKLAEFDRLFFKEFGSSALEWELVYFINSNEYSVFLESRHVINMKLKQYFEKQKIKIAYPTQSIELKR